MNKHLPAAVILAIHFLIFALVNQTINPHPDMVDHWMWSRDLHLSYFEHPPMVAWMFRILTFFFGHSETALETGAQLVNIVILALLYAFTVSMYGQEGGLTTLLILCSMPYFTLGSVFLHITQPFLISWIAALFLLIRFHRQSSVRWLLLLGIAAGLGALSKYVMLLFYISMFLHLLLYRENRRHLLNPGVYLAGMISLLFFIPVIWWNAEHEWISFRWQLAKGTGGAEFGENTGLFTIGHLLLFSPVWAVAGGWGIWKFRDRIRIAQSPESIITVMSIFPLCFFTVMSLKGSIADPHWVNLFYLGIAIMLGGQLSQRTQVLLKKWIIGVGLLLNAILIGLTLLNLNAPLFDWQPFELKNKAYLRIRRVPANVLLKLDHMRHYNTYIYRDRLRDQLGQSDFDKYGALIERVAKDIASDRFTRVLEWDQTGKQMQELLKRKGVPEPKFIVSREYQLSSALAFHMSGRPFSHSIEKPERNIWSPIKKVKKGPSIFVCDLQDCQQALEKFSENFAIPLEEIGDVVTLRGERVVRDLLVYRFSEI